MPQVPLKTDETTTADRKGIGWQGGENRVVQSSWKSALRFAERLRGLGQQAGLAVPSCMQPCGFQRAIAKEHTSWQAAHAA